MYVTKWVLGVNYGPNSELWLKNILRDSTNYVTWELDQNNGIYLQNLVDVLTLFFLNIAIKV